MLNLVLILFPQIVEPQAVLLPIHDGQQLGLEQLTLGRVQQALEHRALHPLSVVDALFGDLPQPFASGINDYTDHYPRYGADGCRAG